MSSVHRLAVLAAILLAGAYASAFAGGTLRRQWTFEQPGFGTQTNNIADHCLIQYDGQWHLFHTHIATPDHPEQYIGHAVSQDLRNWTELAPVIVAEPSAPEWRRRGVWAPHVVVDPLGGFVMAYTGVEQDLAQRIGFLRSPDLNLWEEIGTTPFEPDLTHYAWAPDGYNSCRDPHLIHIDEEWHMVFAARSAGDSAVAVGHASSSDLVSWEQHPALLTEGMPGEGPDLESPGMMQRGGHFLLFYSYQGVRLARSTQFTGPWPGEESMQLDPISSAGELVPSGAGLLFSRRRSDPCRPGKTIAWIDSLDANGWPYHTEPWSRLPGWAEEQGDGFAGQPTFGDGALARGETPTEPSHLFLLSSREDHPEPTLAVSCTNERGGEPRGLLRSESFVLDGDTVAVRIGGADSPDSAYVRLRDSCTNRIYASFTGGSATLERKTAAVTPGHKGAVEWILEDGLDRPGGWLELDDLEVLASLGLPPVPALPPVSWAFPLGGEDFQPGERPTISWLGANSATLDSLVLYLTYDDGRTLWKISTFDGGKWWTKWTVPDTVSLDVRLRIVAFAKNGARNCATTEPFFIGRTVSAELSSGTARTSLRVRYGAGGPWLEGVAAMSSAGQAARLELFDLRGRMLAVAWTGAAGASFRVAVPRHGDDGVALPTGIVFARLQSASGTANATIWLSPSSE